MNKKVSYFAVQLKKMWKVFPGICLFAFLSCVCVVLLFSDFIKDRVNGEKQQKYRVAVVGNLEDSYLGFGVQAVRSLDDSKYVIDFLPYTEEAAEQAFLRDEIAAIVTIPEGFVDSLVYGKNDVPITYRVSDAQKGIGEIFLEEYSKVASTLVANSQAGIYAMQECLVQENRTDLWEQATDELNLIYLGLVVNRTDICDVEITGISNGLAETDYLVCGIAIYVCTLLGIAFGSFFRGKSNGMAKLLQARGFSAVLQVLAEYGAYMIGFFAIVLLMLVTLGAMYALGLLGEVSIMKLPDLVTPVFGLLSVLVTVSALQFFLYEITEGTIGGILLQFLLGTGLCYIAGCFYPASFFPEPVSVLGKAIPYGIAMKHLAACLLGEPVVMTFLGLWGYAGLWLSLSCVLRRYRILRG